MKFKDIMSENENAFDPFYDEEIVLVLKNGQRQTIRCSVMTDATQDEPLSDEMLDTPQKSISLVFRRCDYVLIADVKRGDKIEYDGGDWAVYDIVNDFALGFIVRAREV